MPDLEAEVPQHVQDGLDQARRPLGRRSSKQEQEINIGVGGEFTPAVAADRDHAQSALGVRMARPDVIRVIEKGGDDTVHQNSVLPRRLQPVVRCLEAPTDGGAGLLECLGQYALNRRGDPAGSPAHVRRRHGHR